MKGGNRGKEWIIWDEEREWSEGGYLNKSRVSREDRWVDGNVWGDNRGDENR